MNEILRISDTLKRRKEQKGLTAQQLADQSGVPLSTISRIFAGHTDSPTFSTVSALARVLDLSLDELAGISVRPDPLTEAERKELEMLREEKALLLKYLDVKNRWIRILFFVVLAFAALIIGALIYDRLNPGVGFFWLRLPMFGSLV